MVTLRAHPSKAPFMNLTGRGNSDTQDQVRRKPRVMIYGVGFYGMEAVRILAKKGWPIVAAVNRTGPKIGQDLGRLAGLNEDLGVIVRIAKLPTMLPWGRTSRSLFRLKG
jgi:hypothetical protein